MTFSISWPSASILGLRRFSVDTRCSPYISQLCRPSHVSAYSTLCLSLAYWKCPATTRSFGTLGIIQDLPKVLSRDPSTYLHLGDGLDEFHPETNRVVGRFLQIILKPLEILPRESYFVEPMEIVEHFFWVCVVNLYHG